MKERYYSCLTVYTLILGITLSLLWKRLSLSGEDLAINIKDPLFLNFIWSLILPKNNIHFYSLPSPRCNDDLIAELDRNKQFHGRSKPNRQPALFNYTNSDHSAVRKNFLRINISFFCDGIVYL